MDSPDWNRLVELVNQYGHGPVVFEFDGEEYIVEDVTFMEEEEKIVVLLQ